MWIQVFGISRFEYSVSNSFELEPDLKDKRENDRLAHYSIRSHGLAITTGKVGESRE
jgi:hypothetical protein